MTRAQRVFRLLGYVLAGLAIAGLSVAGYFYFVGDDTGHSLGSSVRHGMLETLAPAALLFDQGSRVNILLVGEDVPINERRIVLKEDSRADSNMLISLDQATNSVTVISLPRDLRIVIPGQDGTGHKLNAAHRHGGMPTLLEAIRLNLGITVHHYIKTNADGFVKLVDQLGGVDVDVERKMDYDDNWQEFHVHLEPGMQHLDGEQAEGYVRWRKNNDGSIDPEGDVGRIRRQQKVLTLLAAKALAPTNLVHLPSILRSAREYVQSDLTDRQFGALMTFMQAVDLSAIRTETLPCDYRRPFMYLRRDEAVAMLSETLDLTFDSSAIYADLVPDRARPSTASEAPTLPAAAPVDVSPDPDPMFDDEISGEPDPGDDPLNGEFKQPPPPRLKTSPHDDDEPQATTPEPETVEVTEADDDAEPLPTPAPAPKVEPRPKSATKIEPTPEPAPKPEPRPEPPPPAEIHTPEDGPR